MEEWRDVVGYEGYYEVSSEGRVRSRDRNYKRKGEPVGKIRKGRILHQNWVHDGYRTVSLSVDGNTKIWRVHRLVGMAFVPNEHNYPCINHKDENRANNRADNLEWCTHKYNTNYGNCVAKSADKKKKPVFSIDKDGTRTWYRSAKDASAFGFSSGRIRACVRGESMTHKGLRWEAAS